MPFDRALAVDENLMLPPAVLQKLRDTLRIQRTTSTITTEALAPGTRRTGTLDLGDEYQLISVQVSSKARLRLYSTAAFMASDLDRPIGTDPKGIHGVILDVHLEAADGVFGLSPQVLGATPPTEEVVYYALDNMGPAAAVITASLISRRLE